MYGIGLAAGNLAQLENGFAAQRDRKLRAENDGPHRLAARQWTVVSSDDALIQAAPPSGVEVRV